MSGENVNYLSMSDEDLLKQTPPEAIPDAPAEVVAEEPAPAETGADADPAPEAQPEKEPDTPADSDADDAPAAGGTPEAGSESEVKDEPKAPEAKAPADDKAAPAPADPAPAAIDYEAAYKKLTAPFKANGRDIQVSSVDEAVALMQMGANYNKKMAALKPNLALLKMLEKSELLSVEKISFLIDLSRKDPAAINKLVSDSGIDPLDLTAEKAQAYKQSSYAVDEREVELDTVLDEIQDSPTYTQTLDLVSNKWDSASKQIVAREPQLLKTLDAHMASGVYSLISAELERKRMFGGLKGLTDIEAYRQVGDEIDARGGFAHLFPKEQVVAPADNGKVVQPTPKVDDGKRDERRRAASTTPEKAPAAPANQDFNPLALDDKAFEEMINKRLA